MKWLGNSPMSFTCLSSSRLICFAPDGGLNAKSGVATSLPVFQFRSWTVYCGPSAIPVDVMTYRHGRGFAPCVTQICQSTSLARKAK